MRSAAGVVGRDDVLAELRAAVARGESLVVVRGALGIGKSTVVSDLVAALRARGRRIEAITARASLQSVPLGALASYIPAAAEGAPSHSMVLHGVSSALSSRGPSAIVVDDVHWLDDESAVLLADIALHEQLTVVVSVREEDGLPPSLAEALVRSDGRVHDLRPLDAAESAALLRRWAPRPLDEDAIAWATRVAGGNPLYLQALASGLLDDHQIPARLSDLVAARLDRLDTRARRLLEVLAVAEQLELSVVEELSDIGCLAGLEERRFTQLHVHGRRRVVALAHPLHAEVLRGRLPVSQRLVIMRRLADAISQTRRRRRDDAFRAASWSLQSGRVPPTRMLVEAARRALARVDPASAERLALAAVEREPGSHHAAILRATALTQMGRGVEAERAFGELSEVLSDARAQAEVATLRALNRAFGLHDPGAANETLAAAAATASSAAPMLAATEAVVALYVGDLPAVRRLAAGQLSDETERTPASVLFGAVAASERVLALDLDRAAALNGSWTPTAHALQAPDSAFLLLSVEVSLAFLRGDLAQAAAILKAAREAPTSAGGHGVLDSLEGWVATLRGRCRTGAKLQHAALTALAGRDPFGHRAAYASTAARACAALGDARAAHRHAAVAAEAVGPATQLWAALAMAAEGWAEAADGDLARASALFADGSRLSLEREDGMTALLLAHDVARMGQGSTAIRLVESIGSVLPLPPLAAAIRQHAEAVAAGCGQTLESAAQALVGVGLELAAAESLHLAAAAHDRAGRHASSWAAARMAERLFARCEVAGSAVATSLAPRRSRLTPRQEEVCSLAARGLSSKAIAARLGLSVRTIDNHLAAAYQRLGVEGRDELRSAVAVSAPSS